MIPVQFKTEQRLDNLFSGDRRIRFTGFHIIFVYDSEDTVIGHVFEQDRRKFEGVLEHFQAELRENDKNVNLFRSIARFTGPEARKKLVFEYIDKLENGLLSNGARMGDDDVVLFWSVTHGNERNKLFLTNDGSDSPIDRDDLVRRLEFHGHRRLTVLITENCNQATKTGVAPSASELARSSIWKSLYFGHRGTVNISSSSADQEAYSGFEGSVFTEGFKRSFDELRNPKKGVIDVRPADGFVDWVTEFFPTLQTQTKNAFTDAENELASSPGSSDILDKMRKQGTQKPQIIGPERISRLVF